VGKDGIKVKTSAHQRSKPVIFVGRRAPWQGKEAANGVGGHHEKKGSLSSLLRGRFGAPLKKKATNKGRRSERKKTVKKN